MLTQGTKLFGGLSAVTLAGLLGYGFSHNFTDLAATGLWFALGVLVLLTGIVALTRDANLSSIDDAAVRSAPSALPPASPSAWPLVAAAGGAVTLVGVVTDKRYFIAGLVMVGVALFEWTVVAWAERASSSEDFNKTVRSKLLNPVEFPIAAAVGLAVLIFSFSRVMLASTSNVAPILFGVFGALLLVGAVFIARNPGVRKGVIGGLLAIGSIGVAGAGVVAATTGQNPTLTQESHEAKTYARDGATCDATAQPAKDHKPDGAVAAKASTTGTYIYGADGTLTLHQSSGTLDGQPLTLDRGNTVNILFRNDHDGEFRLRIYGGKVDALDANGNQQKDPSGNVLKRTIQFCTSLIPKGKTQLLTFKLSQPSVFGTDKFYAEVPGTSAKLEIVVP